ncbi:MAG: AEC family transporter [Proteobacteria bacterium]|nr:AEC family transporter [Pseudomonadota bacterium]
MWTELLAILAPIYACAALGYAWTRSGRPYDAALVTDLITTVGAPCLVFSRLSTLEIDPGQVYRMAGAAAVALSVLAIVATLILRAAKLPRHTFLAPLVFMNTGNMGLPIALFAFGDAGLALAIGFFTVTSLLHFTIGIWWWTGEASIAALVRTPLAWAAVLGVAVAQTDVQVPGWIIETTTLLGSFTIPLMQITLGVSLAQLSLGRIPRTLALSVLRIGLGLGVGVALAALIGLTGTARGVFILECAMPAAVFNSLMASRHGRSPDEVASVVVLSTLISFASLPLLLAWLR